MTLATRPRRWTCPHGCQPLNDPGKRKCGTCGIGRTTKRTSLKARADSLARQVVMARDGKCRACGAVSRLDWAHLFPRRHHNIRWAPENAVALCRTCHRYYTDHPHSWAQWLIDKFGAMEMVGLEQRANERWDRDYIRVISGLQAQLAAVKEKP